MPGHSKCSVKDCANTSTSGLFNETLSFHRFPKNDAVRKAWIDFCEKPKNWTPTDSSRICSEHFESCCFETNLRDELLQSKSRRRLATNAVPTKGGAFWNESIKVEPLDLEASLSNPIQTSLQETVNECFSIKHENESYPQKSEREIELEQEMIAVKKQCEDQQQFIEQLKAYNNSLANQLSEEKNETNRLEKIIKQHKEQHSNCIVQGHLNHRIKQLLSGTLSSAQLDMVLNVKKKVKWRRDDISRASTLMHISKRAYLFLQKEMYPLPSLRTIQLWKRKIKMNRELHQN